MVIAHCTRCLGKAQGETFEVASSKINHAVSLSRGIPCGDNYNCVEEVSEKVGDEDSTTKIDGFSYSKVEGKSTDKVVLDEKKYTSSKKSKKQY